MRGHALPSPAYTQTEIHSELNPALTAQTLTPALCELEHIRWCRFHFWYHWKPGANAEGGKDPENRLHPCLVPFETLPEADKGKDAESICVLLEVCGNEKA